MSAEDASIQLTSEKEEQVIKYLASLIAEVFGPSAAGMARRIDHLNSLSDIAEFPTWLLTESTKALCLNCDESALPNKANYLPSIAWRAIQFSHLMVDLHRRDWQAFNHRLVEAINEALAQGHGGPIWVEGQGAA